MDASIIQHDVSASLQEDIGTGDITALLIDSEQQVVAELIAREPAVLCGKAWASEVYRQLDEHVELEWLKHDGDKLSANQVFLRLHGNARSILTGERAAMNWLQTLSATATKTAEYAALLVGTHCKLLDTRKTIPGLRYAQKYAVRTGGGMNHRLGLYDRYLIKENHIASCGSIAKAVAKARALNGEVLVEVEVESLAELEQAIKAQADIIMLDNFSLHDMSVAVAMNQGVAKLEVSGNVEHDTLADIASTGVDFISSGALTKHIRAIDLSMRVVDVI